MVAPDSLRQVPDVSVEWLVDLVNEYGHRPRVAAGESDHRYPALAGTPVARVARRELVRTADALWAVFASATTAQRAAVLTRLLAAGHLTPAIDPEGARLWMTAHTAPHARLSAGCATALLAMVEEHTWNRIGVCACVDCDDVYVDVERRRVRRYCSPVCLNRARIRAHRARGKAKREMADVGT